MCDPGKFLEHENIIQKYRSIMNIKHHENNECAGAHAHVKGSIEIEGGYYYGSTPATENKFLTIRLSENEFTQLNHLAQRYNTTKTAMIKGLLKNLLPG